MKQIKFTLGFVAGALVFGSMGVAVASSTKTIDVLFGVKDIKINNVSKMPEQAPFLYQGTTYVPLRYIAESLGSDVRWDISSQTVLINNKQSICLPDASFDVSKYIGTWKTELVRWTENKKTKVKTETGFNLEKTSSGVKLLNGYRDISHIDVVNGVENWQGTGHSDWEIDEFTVDKNGVAESNIHFTADEVTYKVRIEFKQAQIDITILDHKADDFFFNSYIKEPITTYKKINN